MLASMNGAGARDLALVEVQDKEGSRHKAWEGRMRPPVPGFEQTCFEQQLARKQMVRALRFTFSPAQDRIEINHAALLRRRSLGSEQDQVIPVHQLRRLDVAEDGFDLG